MGFQVKVKGFEEAQRKLLSLGREAWLREALAEGAGAIKESVAQYAPGSIRELVISRLAKNEKLAIAYAGIDMKLSRKSQDKQGRRNRYAYIVEYGSRPHRIEGANLRIGPNKFARAVNHPGFPGVKYFARGVRSGRSRAKQLIESSLVLILKRLESGDVVAN